MKIEAYFKENGEKIHLHKIIMDIDGSIMAVQDVDGEMYGSHVFEISIMD